MRVYKENIREEERGGEEEVSNEQPLQTNSKKCCVVLLTLSLCVDLSLPLVYTLRLILLLEFKTLNLLSFYIFYKI